MTAATSADARPATSRPAARATWRPAFDYWLVVYRHSWRGTLTSTLLSPVLYLLAMGVGLGSYVHHGSGHVDGVRYAVFLAPGLLAATAMQTAIAESTWPVMGAVKWQKNYHAMLASPLTVGDIMVGHLVYMTLRVLLGSVVFAVVIAVFGLAHSAGGLVLAVLASLLTGMAFLTPTTAFAITQQREIGFAVINRFVVIPLFLFSGTFFPVGQLPSYLRPLAWVTPLWHGVTLSRDVTLGQGSVAGDLGHVAYLLAVVAIGIAFGRRGYRRRLLT